MEKLDLTCPNCRATMTLDDSTKQAICPYCGHKMLIEKRETVEEAVERAKQVSYAQKEGENLAEEASKKRQIKKKIIRVLTIILVFTLLSFLFVTIKHYSKKYIEDPFQYLTISFSGTDGTGKAQIKISDIDDNDIEFVLSKEEHLSENEKIVVTAKSNKYRFKTDEKTYRVHGLLKYISEPSQITDEIKEFLHNKSYEYQKGEIEKSISVNSSIAALEPYKIFLIAGDQSNQIYDVFKVSIKTKSGNVFDHYVATVYENVIELVDKEDPVKFMSMKKCGNVIHAGDPKEKSAMGKDYAKNLTGFETINDFDNYLITKTNARDSTYKDV